MARKINACDLHQGDVFELTQDEANGFGAGLSDGSF